MSCCFHCWRAKACDLLGGYKAQTVYTETNFHVTCIFIAKYLRRTVEIWLCWMGWLFKISGVSPLMFHRDKVASSLGCYFLCLRASHWCLFISHLTKWWQFRLCGLSCPLLVPAFGATFLPCQIICISFDILSSFLLLSPSAFLHLCFLNSCHVYLFIYFVIF